MPRVYVKTHGCQMNEYDSARMADVLAAAGLEPTDDPAEADMLLLNTCSVREKAQEKVFSQLGRWRAAEAARPDVYRRRRLRRSQEGEASSARALRRPRVRPADAASAARDDRRAAAHGRAASTSRSPRSRSSTGCRSRAPKVPPPSSRSWKAAASTARSASCPTRVARKSAGRSTTCSPKCGSSPSRASARSSCSGRT